MKVPKQVNRHCPRCNKHTVHKVTLSKNRGRNQSRPMSIGSTIRVRMRGQRRGYGNRANTQTAQAENDWQETQQEN